MEENENLKIEWVDAFREPRCVPDPRFPKGIDVDVSMKGEAFCFRSLPYPARRCGFYKIDCSLCGTSVAITTAGRIDDPRSVKIPCKVAKGEKPCA